MFLFKGKYIALGKTKQRNKQQQQQQKKQQETLKDAVRNIEATGHCPNYRIQETFLGIQQSKC